MDEIISNEEGMSSGTSSRSGPSRKADWLNCERKWDQGLDARSEAHGCTSIGRLGIRISHPAKGRGDAASIREHFDDAQCLIFETPQGVNKHTATASGIRHQEGSLRTLVMPRERSHSGGARNEELQKLSWYSFARRASAPHLSGPYR